MTGPEHFRMGLRLLDQAKGVPGNYPASATRLATEAQAHFAACTAMATAEQTLAMMARYGTMLAGQTEDDAHARMDGWAQVIRP